MVLPHPRFHRLFWTAERILATEQSSVGEFGLQPEAMRLVELELAPGSVALVPAGPFEPSLTDVGVSVDGSTIVYVRGSGANSTISAEGALGGRRNVSGARFPDVWLNGGLVGFLGDDGFYSVWEPGSGSVETVSQTWAYASSLSATGRLALAEMTTEIGPTGRVCVTDLSSR